MPLLSPAALCISIYILNLIYIMLLFISYYNDNAFNIILNNYFNYIIQNLIIYILLLFISFVETFIYDINYND